MPSSNVVDLPEHQPEHDHDGSELYRLSEPLDGFKVTLLLNTRTGKVRGLRVEAELDNADGAITARWLREIPLGKIVDSFWRDIALDHAQDAVGTVQEYADADADTVLALTVRAYLALTDAAHPAPTRVLAEELGLPLHAVRTRILDARKSGILSKTKPGEGGGKLTAKGKRLLAKAGVQT